MKILFVDAENIGLKKVEEITVSVFDKVLVFSKDVAVRAVCEKLLFVCLSDYPTGANQADFYLIASLSRLLSKLKQDQLPQVQFDLYTNDKSLSSAFMSQCAKAGVIAHIKTTTPSNITGQSSPTQSVSQPIAIKKVKQSPEDKIYFALKSSKKLDSNLQKQLGLSQSDFSKAVAILMKTNKIKRSQLNKKQWVRN